MFCIALFWFFPAFSCLIFMLYFAFLNHLNLLIYNYLLTINSNMEANSNDNYVLVLEDRTEVKNQQEAGKLTIVSGIDDKGKLKTTEPLEANQAAFLKFNSKDGLLKNFMSNFLKQFNNPSHFGLYKVVASNVVQGVDNLRTLIQSWETPESRQLLAEVGVPFEDYLPKQKKSTAIDAEKVDWKRLDSLGLSRKRLEQSCEIEKMLNWQKSNLVTIAIPVGDTTIYTEARLAFRTDNDGSIGLTIHAMRKEPQHGKPTPTADPKRSLYMLGANRAFFSGGVPLFRADLWQI